MLFREIIISSDVEADGPIPGVNSMLAFGSAAFTINFVQGAWKPQVIDRFTINLEELPEAVSDPATMRWWSEYPEAYAQNRDRAQPPADAMHRYVEWLKTFDKKLVFIAWPATYDFMFMYWYLMRFVGESPFGYSGLDTRSYAFAYTQEKSWMKFSKKKLPSEWLSENPMAHVPLNDAISEGYLGCNLMISNVT